MPSHSYISAHSIIRGNTVYKNGQQLYSNPGVNLSDFVISLYRHLNLQYPKFHKMDNLCKLGWLANEVLLDKSFNRAAYRADEIGIVLSNANSSLDIDLKYLQTTSQIASPALFVYTLPNIVIGEISIRHVFKGENAFFISEKFDPDFIQQYVSNLFNNNILQCCICGWVEALGEEYEAALFLIDKNKTAKSVNFTSENLNKIYRLHNG